MVWTVFPFPEGRRVKTGTIGGSERSQTDFHDWGQFDQPVLWALLMWMVFDLNMQVIGWSDMGGGSSTVSTVAAILHSTHGFPNN